MGLFKWLFGDKQVDEPMAEKTKLSKTPPNAKVENRAGELPKEVQPEKVKSFKTKVAGVSFRRRQAQLKRMAKAIEEDYDFPDISLIREPDNKHDENAIKVIWHEYNEKTDTEKDLHIGYIRNQVASTLSQDIDRGWKVSAEVDEVLGGYDEDDEKELYGVLLHIKINQSL